MHIILGFHFFIEFLYLMFSKWPNHLPLTVIYHHDEVNWLGNQLNCSNFLSSGTANVVRVLLWLKIIKIMCTNSQGRLNWCLLSHSNSSIRQYCYYFTLKMQLTCLSIFFPSRVPLKNSLSISYSVLSFSCGL